MEPELEDRYVDLPLFFRTLIMNQEAVWKLCGEDPHVPSMRLWVHVCRVRYTNLHSGWALPRYPPQTFTPPDKQPRIEQG